MGNRIDARHFSPLGAVLGWKKTDSGFEASLAGAVLHVEALAGDVCRLGMVPDHATEPSPTYAVLPEVQAWSAAHEVGESEGEIVLQAAGFVARLGKADAALTVERPDGSSLMRSTSAPWFSTLNDEFLLRRDRTESEAVFGLGQKTGALNRNGRDFTLWNTDVLNPDAAGQFAKEYPVDDLRHDATSTEFDPYYVSIPFYQVVDETGRATGSFVDDVHRARYEFDHEGQTWIHFAGGAYVEYLFAGPTLRQVVQRYADVTGKMQLPPLWSLGFHYCRWHPYDEGGVLNLAATFRSKGIPCDSLWLDIDHMRGYRVFTWDHQIFPDPQKLSAILKADGFRLVTIVDPGVKVEPGWQTFDDGLAKGVFCRTEGGAVYQGQVWPGKTAFPDFASPKARLWWGDLNAAHVAQGVAGIWNDMNEPATGDIDPGAMRFDEGRHAHSALHNAYATLMAMATVNGLTRARPNERTFVLSRAGSAGIQRYAANWHGDNMSRWEHLAMSLPMTLGIGLSGQPFAGSDVGGFGEDSSGELLARWTQAGALSPFFRNHNAAGNIDQYPWSFGPEVETVCREAIRLRYRLMPYIYSCFAEAAETGAPVMRPMAYEFPGEPRLRDREDQYMLGPHLLVAPVLVEGQRKREVVLPEGGWYDWWTGDRVPTGNRLVLAPLDRIPLFVRAGAVIPMWPVPPASTHGYEPEELVLKVFAAVDQTTLTSKLVEDDGTTTAYLIGERVVTSFASVAMGGVTCVTAAVAGRCDQGKRQGFRVEAVGGPVELSWA